MPRVLLRDVKGLEGKEVKIVAARKHTTWGVIPEGSSSPRAVGGDKLLVDNGMRPPVSLVDVQVDPEEKGGQAILGKADAFRAERWGWPVILANSKPGSAFLAGPGSICEQGCKDAWVAPVCSQKVTRDGKEQMGLFASRPFQPGDCIFVESPLLLVPPEADIDDKLGGVYVNKVHRAAILRFVALPDPTKARILELFCPEHLRVTVGKGQERWQEEVTKDAFFEHLAKLGVEVGSDEHDKAVIWRFIRIWDVNCADVAGGIGLLGWTSRANHSCQPNATRSLLPGGQMANVAIQAIAAGEEIFCSYLLDDDLLKPREKRQELLKPWNFKCACSRCSSAEDTLVDGGTTPEAEADIQKLISDAKGAAVDLSELRSAWAKFDLPDNHWLRPQVDAGLRDLEELEGNYLGARDRQAAILKFWDEMLPAAASIQRARLRGMLGDHERRLGNYMDALRLYCEGLAEVSSFQFAGHTTVEELRGKLQSLLTCEKGNCKQ